MNTTELKALAEKATPGPWIAAGPSFGAEHAVYYEDVVVDREGDEDDTFQVCQSPTGLEEQSSNDMEFIGAANPAAILTLIADLESAQDERRALLATEQNLRERVKALEEGLVKCVETLTDTRIGQWSYMEGSEIYDDFGNAVQHARALLEKTT